MRDFLGNFAKYIFCIDELRRSCLKMQIPEETKIHLWYDKNGMFCLNRYEKKQKYT